MPDSCVPGCVGVCVCACVHVCVFMRARACVRPCICAPVSAPVCLCVCVCVGGVLAGGGCCVWVQSHLNIMVRVLRGHRGTDLTPGGCLPHARLVRVNVCLSVYSSYSGFECAVFCGATGVPTCHGHDSLDLHVWMCCLCLCDLKLELSVRCSAGPQGYRLDTGWMGAIRPRIVHITLPGPLPTYATDTYVSQYFPLLSVCLVTVPCHIPCDEILHTAMSHPM
jgi:hypothetical protein